MNKKIAIPVIVGAMLIIAALAWLLYNANSGEPAALRNASAGIISSYDLQAKDTRNKINELLNDLNEKAKEPGREEKVRPYYDRAIELKKIADSLITYIDTALASIRSQGAEAANEPLKINTPLALRNRLDAAYAKMMGLQPLEDTVLFNKQLRAERYPFDLRDTVGWEDHMLGNGVTKSIALMNLWRVKAMVTDIELLHIAALCEIANRGCRLPFSPYGAVAFPQSAYLFTGDRSEASIWLLNTKWLEETGHSIKEIKVDGKNVPVVNSVGHYTGIANVPGLHAHTGTITVDGGGDVGHSYDFKWEYFVAAPAVHVAYDKPIVLEAGKVEPVMITTGYIIPGDIVVSLSRGSIKGSDGHYVIKVDEPGTVKLIVARKFEGKIHNIDSFTYDVK